MSLEDDVVDLSRGVIGLIEDYVFIKNKSIIFQNLGSNGDCVFECKNIKEAEANIGYIYTILVNLIFDAFELYDDLVPPQDFSEQENKLNFKPSLN